MKSGSFNFLVPSGPVQGFLYLFYVLVIMNCLCILILQLRVALLHFGSRRLNKVCKKAIDMCKALAYRTIKYTSSCLT